MYPRSFRARLTWFFVVIVLLPMAAVSAVLFQLVSDSERGRSDARLGQAQRTAVGLYRAAERRAAVVGREMAASTGLAQALAARDDGRIDAELAVLRRRTDAARVELDLADGGGLHTAGDGAVLAGARTTLVRGGGPAGTLWVGMLTVRAYADQVRSLTGLQVVVARGDATLASTIRRAAGDDRLPAHGEATFAGREFRVAGFTVPSFDGGGRLRVSLLADGASIAAQVRRESLAVVALLGAFLLLACAFAFLVSRSLQAQVQRLLQGAQRLGAGDLSVRLPTEGDDEFAALGSQFNAMARQLRARLEELEGERRRLQHAIRRVGESFAKTLDRDALLRIVVQTAVDGVGAAVGRASVRELPGGPFTERAVAGDGAPFADAVQDAEARALESGEAAEAGTDDRHALAQPLRATDATEVLGLLTVARPKPFSPAERDLFDYLATQAAVALRNVGLHETVRREAVTDELTGLFNHRRFQEVIAAEVERARRFEQPLGLIMLDIDDFKAVNDRYGHLQGDRVLREVARVLLACSREIDEPARYGGEELAIALPQTDLEGAHRFAERLRAAIEELEVPLVGGEGVVRVTASLGAAAAPESAVLDKDALVGAADAALYRAKRLGKNRVARAG